MAPIKPSRTDALQSTFDNFQRRINENTKAILRKRDLKDIILQNLPNVGESQRAIIKDQLLEYLWKNELLKEVVFEFPSRKETRYLLGRISNLELAISLKPNAYLSHHAAAYIHGLTDRFPDMIYINVEQTQHHHRNKSTLTQDAINQAFKNKPRISNDIAEGNGMRVCITHGQRTDGLGVRTIHGPDGENLRATDLERTLIDIAVRPAYAGGVKEVLRAYKRAKNVSLQGLLAMVKELNYVYPYHQAIGFYLDSTNQYEGAQLDLFRSEIDFDFYIDYRIPKPHYSAKWRLHYPHDLL